MPNRLTIEYGDDLLFRLGLTKEAFSKEARLLLAAKLYELGRLSSGEAAQFCGFDRVQFLFELGRIGIPTSNLRLENLTEELNFALNE